ncbi:hypothetical protein [Gottschalkia purinilytica]|uniref:hypothetical protein n=1 Tax=Gottschalkia purinilytica TaxID=1503 RepID=UPI001039AACC|nr:hypothetical protein [Gottschalkia purinilytica]
MKRAPPRILVISNTIFNIFNNKELKSIAIAGNKNTASPDTKKYIILKAIILPLKYLKILNIIIILSIAEDIKRILIPLVSPRSIMLPRKQITNKNIPMLKIFLPLSICPLKIYNIYSPFI